MTYQLIATTDKLSRISDPFEDRHECIAFARKQWKRMKAAHVKKIVVRDTCGDDDVLFPPATPAAQIPAGYYAHDGKRYHLSQGSGKWEGWTFLATGSDYHDRKTIASVRPDGSFSRQHSVMTAIMADPFARAAEYGRITGTCSVCGRKLENPDSRAIGIGPKCRQRFGM